MDDVIEASGVSPSVLYRWFRGKEDLINATVDVLQQGLVDVMDELLGLDPPPSITEIIERVLSEMVARAEQGGADPAALALHTWAEALRNPEIHAMVFERYRVVREGLAELIRRHQATGALPSDLDADAAAGPLFSMLPGFAVQRLLLGTGDVAAYAKAAGALLRA